MIDDLLRPLDVRKAALLAGVSPTTIRWWISEGLLDSVLVEGKRYMREIDVLNCERGQRAKAKARKGGNRRRRLP
ncbi:MerR family transcriptional regulator [Janibacter sp. GS2]|uniref:MerR family transcriptional regulator n=1 Tax=Janibacter sp. GS2 TaxID=3442646 RepID=UPI003EB7B256